MASRRTIEQLVEEFVEGAGKRRWKFGIFPVPLALNRERAVEDLVNLINVLSDKADAKTTELVLVVDRERAAAREALPGELLRAEGRGWKRAHDTISSAILRQLGELKDG